MPSANFTVDDAMQSVRKQVSDDAQRRYPDVEIIAYQVPRVMQQLYSDRPDLFMGSFGTVNFKPGQLDPLPFDDVGFNAFVEALIAVIEGAAEESTSQGLGSAADARSERARKQ